MLEMPFWPHVWAVPVIFVAGAFVGWWMKGIVQKDAAEQEGPRWRGLVDED